MDKKTIFQILGISEIKDREAIQAAYRKNLIKVNPEDDPEGFKRLRKAYEEAIRLIDTEEEEKAPETEIDFWILKVKEVYGRLSTRIHKASWECLLQEDLCQDIEMEDEVREALLVFLMKAYHLPQEIWRLIEETFQIESNKELLYEKFPPDFIDYVIERVHTPTWIDYTLFEGEDEADYDTFLGYYFQIQGELSHLENEEKIKALFEQIDKTNIWHPYIEVEKLRYYLACGKKDEAAKLGDKLKKYEESTYIRYYLSSLAWEKENFEEAYHICMQILEKDPEHFGARVRVCDYYLKIGEYEKAKEGYLELREMAPHNQKLEEACFEANSHLITLYKEKLVEKPDDDAIKVELGWCLLQNKHYEECLELLESIKIGQTVSSYQYCSLKAHLYFYMEDYEKATFNLEAWIEEILKGEEESKRFEKLHFAYDTLASAYSRLEAFDKALTYLEKALTVSQEERSKLEVLSKKAYILLKMERYEACVDLCDQILKKERDFLPAYVYRQEAYYELRRAQEVIDDFYNIIEIFPSYAKAYRLATRVFYIYRQFEDAKNILERAHSNEVESYELELLELKIKWRESDLQHEMEEVEKELAQLVEKAKENLGDLEDLSEVLQEQAICNANLNNFEKALELVDQALLEKESDTGLELKADFLYNSTRYNEALDIYQQLERENFYDDRLKCDIGDCFRNLGSEDSALRYYISALKVNPESDIAAYRLMMFYKIKYREDYDLEDYEKAMTYGKKFLELSPSADEYVELARFCLEGKNTEEAVYLLEKAIEQDPDYVWAYNDLGVTHKILGNYEDAYQWLEKAIKVKDRIKTKDPEFNYFEPYWKLAELCRVTRDYEKAIEIYQYLVESYQDESDEDFEKAVNELAYTYKQTGESEKAIEQYGRLEGVTKDVEYLQNISKCFDLLGRYEEAEDYLKKALEQAPMESDSFRLLGEHYWWVLGEERKALKYYKTAIEVAEKNNEFVGYLTAINGFLELMKQMGKEDECKKYVKEIEKFIEAECGSVEWWISNPKTRKLSLYYVTMWYYALGDYEKVRAHIEAIKQTRNCDFCTYCECIDLYELEILLLIEEGQYEKASKIYQQLIKSEPSALYNIHLKRKLEKKLKGIKG